MNKGNILKIKKKKFRSHDGEGLLDFARIYDKSESMFSDCTINFIDVAIIPPGCSVGYHKHENQTEVYLILEGEGVYRQDEQTYHVELGDVLINHGGSHSLINNTSRELKIFVFETQNTPSD